MAKLEIAELLELQQLSGRDPFASPDETLAWFGELDAIRGAGMTVAGLRWLLHHEGTAILDLDALEAARASAVRAIAEVDDDERLGLAHEALARELALTLPLVQALVDRLGLADALVLVGDEAPELELSRRAWLRLAKETSAAAGVEMHLHAYSPMEIAHMCDISGLPPAEVFARLHPREKWRPGYDTARLVAEMRESLSEIPGVKLNFSQPIKDRVEEAVSGVRGKVVLKVFGEDLDAMRGTLLHAPREAMPDAEEGEFYVADLIGMAVVHVDGRELGHVAAVQNFGAGELIEVKPAKGGSFLLPFTQDNFPEIDPATRVLELVIKDSAPAATSGSITAMLGLFPLGGAPSTTSKSAVLTVNARRLSIDLSPWLTPEVVTFGPVSLTLVGECGMTSTFGLGVLTQGRGPQLSLTGFQCL